jgi:general secretion pathway protein M
MTRGAWRRGRPAQALAAGITLLPAAAFWFAVVAPARDWFLERNALLEHRHALLARMQAAARDLPRLRQAAHDAVDPGADGGFLSGSGDAVAAAMLQERIQAIAAAEGIVLTTIETVPPDADGRWRRVGLRLSFSAPWPRLIDFLRHVDAAPVRIFADDLHLTGEAPPRSSVQVSMLAYGFRLVQDSLAR